MKISYSFKKCLLGISFLLVTGLVSCKKNNTDTDSGEINEVGVPSTGSRTQLTQDSIFLYARQIYFWNDAIPDYVTFQPRNYTGSTALASYKSELYAITQLKINPATGKPYEYYSAGVSKYSYIQDLTLANPSASSNSNTANVDTEGNGNDIGIRPIFYTTTKKSPLTYLLFVTAVYPNSPAEAAGIKRGWVITKVNGQTIGANYDTESSSVIAALSASSVSIAGYNYWDGVPFNLTLVKSSYKSSPVYASKVFTKSGKKIGYLSFARFSVLSNPSSTAPSDVNLDPVFANFSTQGVTDLVVDLRYNGGGYVNTAEYLANLIAPSSLTGKKMYTETYNATMQAGKATILSHQPLLDANNKLQYQNGKMLTYADLDFSTTAASNNANFAKKGSLNTVTNIVFIVSRNTASASELLINSLKPYITVKLVGDTTYGKPVGFFPIKLENRYDVYMSLFETRNANNEGGYYAGMVPTTYSGYDDPTYPFGDEKDNYLSLALNLIAPSIPVPTQKSVLSVGGKSINIATFKSSQLKPVNPNSEFTGMIETRHTLKK